MMMNEWGDDMNTYGRKQWTETMVDVDAQYVNDGRTRVLLSTLGDAQHGIWPDAHVFLNAGQTLTICRDNIRAQYRDVLRVTLRLRRNDCVQLYNVIDVVAYHVNVTMDIEFGGTITLHDVNVSVSMDNDGYPMCRVFGDDIIGLDVADVTAFRVVMRQRDGG